MAEILEGSSPGIPFGEIVAICADDFGYRPDNTRFKAHVIRNANRAILDIWLDFPKIRRFLVLDADITIQTGVAEYNVAETVDNGGWGWTNCIEIKHLVLPNQQSHQLEIIDVGAWRSRQDYMVSAGPPVAAVLIDQQRVRIVPTPDYDATGKGDYYRASPYISDVNDRVSWPQGWDQVVLLGAEYYLARFYRPELKEDLKRDYAEGREKLKFSEIDGGPLVKYAVVARNIMRRRFRRHDNSQDIGWR